MRGVVSLAAALAIPVSLGNGDGFPYRSLILFITFVVILLTLLVQGLTLPYFITRSRLFDPVNEESEEQARQKIKRGLREHISRYLKNKHESGLQDHAGMRMLMKHWEEKAKAGDDNWMDEQTKALFIEMLDSQREYLTELNKDLTIDEEIIRDQLYQIDLEEERLKLL
jgi:CPA1 family monovalent cation:H+ antiporter